MFQFNVSHFQGKARTGRLSTPHGEILTPAFVPVGTQATVKSIRPRDLLEIKSQLLICNTYHLYLRPGVDVISNAGGLHGFMNWKGPIMTDSGGFQVLSLGAGIEHGVGKTVKLFADSTDDSRVEALVDMKKSRGEIITKEKFCFVSDERIIFKSHLDGTFHEWTPEKSMEIQSKLGADIVFALDECTSPLHNREYTEKSLHRSHAWEERSIVKFRKLHNKAQEIYGIVQGGPYEDLRTESTKFVESHDFFGVGIGGALVNKTVMEDILDWVSKGLSGKKPVHLLGIGGIDDIFAGVEKGVDSFDCADPTRIARRGDILLSPDDGGTRKNRWRANIAVAEFRDDLTPLGINCGCPSCSEGFSKSYVNHLMWSRELTGYTLTTIHNLFVMEKLMAEIREGIAENKLEKVRERWMG
ncbi:tRNA guanosine(34) transglycosylase Tgt [Candidatus Collierbacteria bacterium]|nr:tRNA guanosine(34) transglycosylase Tgt [Candidatus Collierbacteria bacterium]